MSNILKTTVILLGSPIALILLTPALVYRFIIKHLALKFRPDLGKMLDSISTAFAVSKDHLGYNVLATCRVRGKLNFPRMVQLVNTRLVHAKAKEKTGEDESLVLKELQQTVTSWMGYYFYKQEDNFQIEDHVTQYKRRAVNHVTLMEEEIFDIEQEIINTPLNPKKSFWKFYFVDGGKNDDFFLMIIVGSHILGDGQTFFHNIIGRLWDPPESESVPPSVSGFRVLQKQKIKESWVTKLQLPFRAASEFATHFFKDPRNHVWYMENEKRSKNRIFVKSELIDVSEIKDLYRKFGTTFTGAVLSGLTGGIREYLKDKGHFIPKVMGCMIPFPTHKVHPDGCSNTYNYLHVDFPVGLSDSAARFKTCEEILQEAKRSTVILTGSKFLDVTSALGNLMPSFDICGLDLSIMAGPSSPLKIDGRDVIELGPMLFHGRNVETISMVLTSYNGKFRLVLSCDGNFMKTKEEAKKLLACMVNHLKMQTYNSENGNIDTNL